MINDIKKISSVNDNCVNYVNLLYSDGQFKYKNDVPDPLLLIAMMQQESSCGTNSNIDAGGSKGLLQITEKTFDAICKTESLTYNKIYGSGNEKNNIDCAVKILKDSYEHNKNGRIFYNKNSDENYKSCDRIKDTKYYEWEAALRGYVGWGCAQGHDNYVEDVMARYNELVNSLA